MDLECLARMEHAVATTVSVAIVTSFALPKSVYPTAMPKLNAEDVLPVERETARSKFAAANLDSVARLQTFVMSALVARLHLADADLHPKQLVQFRLPRSGTLRITSPGR